VSQFEYVSIAIALVFSLLVARLIGGLPHLSAKDRDSWIVLAWTLATILGAVASWWIFWRFREVAWTPVRFVWLLATPGLLYLQASVLLTDNPSQVPSWETHFFAVRRRFFGIMMVVAFHGTLMPWVFGLFAWGAAATAHPATLTMLVVSIVGLVASSRAVQLALALAVLTLNLLALFFTPEFGRAAA